MLTRTCTIKLQIYRQALLEILHKLAQNASVKAHVIEFAQGLLDLVKVENEVNAVVCLKILMELHRIYKTSLEDQIQPFLDLIKTFYRNMPEAINENFDAPDAPAGLEVREGCLGSCFIIYLSTN